MIYLPLYSTQGGIHVPERSGLNHWNADGRPRNFNEVYIPIPAVIHRIFPNYLPNRDTYFALITPNNDLLISKVCQDGSKSIMSHPNSDLGHWLLRQVLNISPGILATYQDLVNRNINSVCIHRLGENDGIIDNHSSEELANRLNNIFRTKNHSIFHVGGNQQLSDSSIRSIFDNIIANNLFYYICPAPWNSYQNQF